MSSAACMDGVICDMSDIVERYGKLDRIIRFDSAVTVAKRRRSELRKDNSRTKSKSNAK